MSLPWTHPGASAVNSAEFFEFGFLLNFTALSCHPYTELCFTQGTAYTGHTHVLTEHTCMHMCSILTAYTCVLTEHAQLTQCTHMCPQNIHACTHIVYSQLTQCTHMCSQNIHECTHVYSQLSWYTHVCSQNMHSIPIRCLHV